MKTPKFLIYLTAAGIIMTACEKKHEGEGESKDTTKTEAVSAETSNYNVDSSASIVKWVGKKVTGQHNGTAKLKSGTLALEGDKVKGGSFEIDLSTIKVVDLTDKKMNEKLVGHLKSPDFFDVAKHPIASFVITGVEGNTAKGNLTVKDSTAQIEVTFDAKKEGEAMKITGKSIVDRTKLGIKYGSGKFFENLGDKMIYDDIELEFEVVAKK